MCMVFLAHWSGGSPWLLGCTWPHFCGRSMWNMKDLPAAPFQLFWRVLRLTLCLWDVNLPSSSWLCVGLPEWLRQQYYSTNESPGLGGSDQQWPWSFRGETSTQAGWFVSRSHHWLLKVNKREGTEITTIGGFIFCLRDICYQSLGGAGTENPVGSEQCWDNVPDSQSMQEWRRKRAVLGQNLWGFPVKLLWREGWKSSLILQDSCGLFPSWTLTLCLL